MKSPEYYELLNKISKTKNMKFVRENLHKIESSHLSRVAENPHLAEDIVLEISLKTPYAMRHPNLPHSRISEVLLDNPGSYSQVYLNHAVGNPNSSEEFLLEVIEKHSNNTNLLNCMSHNRNMTLPVLLSVIDTLSEFPESWYCLTDSLAFEATNQKVMEYLIEENLSIMQLSENPNLDENLIQQILEKHLENDAAMTALAKHKNTTAEQLDMISKSDYEWVKTKVAFNSKTSIETLKRLGFDPSANVRKHIAKNPNTPVELLRYLLKDKSTVVRNNAKKNLEKRCL